MRACVLVRVCPAGQAPAARIGPLGVGEEGREERAGAGAGEVEEAAADGVLAVAHVEPVEGGGRPAAAGLVRHAREGFDRLRPPQPQPPPPPPSGCGFWGREGRARAREREREREREIERSVDG